MEMIFKVLVLTAQELEEVKRALKLRADFLNQLKRKMPTLDKCGEVERIENFAHKLLFKADQAEIIDLEEKREIREGAGQDGKR